MAVPPSDLHPLLEPKPAEPTQEFDPSVLLVDDDGTTAAWWSALADTASLAATEPATTNLPPAEDNQLPDLASTGSIDALLLSLLTYTPADLNPTVASPSASATSTCAATPTIPTSPTAAHPTPEALPELRPRAAKRATDDATRTIQPNCDPKTMNPTESSLETSRKRSVDASDSITVVGSPPPPAKRTRRGLTEEEVQLRKQERSRRNREAAQLSREKKKRQVEDLEAHNLTLAAENATLATRMDALEAQNRRLAQQLEECNRLVRTLVATQPPLAADMTARLVACAVDCGPPNPSRDGSINHGPEHNDGSRGPGTSALPSPTSSNVSSPPTGAVVDETLAPAAEDPGFGKTAVLDQPTSTGVEHLETRPDGNDGDTVDGAEQGIDDDDDNAAAAACFAYHFPDHDPVAFPAMSDGEVDSFIHALTGLLMGGSYPGMDGRPDSVLSPSAALPTDPDFDVLGDVPSYVPAFTTHGRAQSGVAPGAPDADRYLPDLETTLSVGGPPVPCHVDPLVTLPDLAYAFHV
ncbi:hypothetical protein IWQ60_012063 [Tieghemiomyces parasiticus]|uniref:BZIP domain-containing protein n=1 Tax=Tieghemiomyces parasiticus TaxID=78921 RepID=A0A9W8DKY9_9FUNG|nr:hypothetical protein IWQ60_012063 [Tieghemiomyces parasiticus]